MPRFLLGSHPQQNKDHDKHPNRLRLPFKKDTVQTWWRRLKRKKSSSASSSASSSSSSSPQARDWRSLSPHEPPLPFVGTTATTEGQSGIVSNTVGSNNTSRRSHAGTVPTLEGGIATRFSSSSFRQSAGSIEERPTRNLYTIFEEESESAMTDSSYSVSRPRPLSWQTNDDDHERHQKRLSASSSHGLDAQLSDDNNSSTSTTSSSVISYQLPSLWHNQQTKLEPQFDPSLIGDEDKCRRQFIAMVQSAHRALNQQKGELPKQVELLFDAQDNVQFIIFNTNGKQEKHKSRANGQYIPPEWSVRGTFDTNLAVVWGLGISLYRMLVGKYPFTALNDRKLFKKMLHAEFSIPQHLSDDVKDLLRRMLSPDPARASIDLVLFHPWIKPVKSQYVTPSPRSTPHVNASLDPIPVDNAGGKQRDDKHMVRVLAQIVFFIVEGPFPPPKRPYKELAPPMDQQQRPPTTTTTGLTTVCV